MLENSQINASKNLYSLPPLLPPHQLTATVLGEVQHRAGGTRSSVTCLPTRWQYSLICSFLHPSGRQGVPRRACHGQHACAAHPLRIIGLPLSIFTQQTGVQARQSLQKGYRTQLSWIQAWILGSIDSLPVLIPQNKLPYPTPTVT